MLIEAQQKTDQKKPEPYLMTFEKIARQFTGESLEGHAMGGCRVIETSMCLTRDQQHATNRLEEIHA